MTIWPTLNQKLLPTRRKQTDKILASNLLKAVKTSFRADQE